MRFSSLSAAAAPYRSRRSALASRAAVGSCLAIAFAACAVGDDGSASLESSSDSLSFEAPGAVSEWKGLAPRPTRTTTSVAGLRALVGSKLPEVLAALDALHGPQGQARIIESFSAESALVLSSTHAMAPYADGVFEPALAPGATLDSQTACSTSGTHVCEPYFDPADRHAVRDVLVLVGKRVELSADVKTDGRSLVIVADEFVSNGFTIDTAPLAERTTPVAVVEPIPGAAGRAGVSAGHVAIVAARVEGVRVTANGEPGTAGVRGKNGGPGANAFTTRFETVGGVPQLRCDATTADVNRSESASNPSNFATAGGAGGSGGDAGRLFLAYARFVDGSAAAGSEVRPQSACFGACASDPACALDPSVVACDLAREVDNVRCRDGRANSGRGAADCGSASCKASPFATVCRAGSGIEATVEACSDRVDNDANGKVDCDDSRCAALSICDGRGAAASAARFRIVTTGVEESTNTSCSDGLDNDADGKIDCNDAECTFNPLVTVCGGGEKTLEACSNGRDDDGDGKRDCADPGCTGNPYVLVCGTSPFLRESTNASCADRSDNDRDGFVDCKDYGCQNNPVVRVCGSYENSLALCTNGRDDDGDGKVDCADPHCWFNPFFGDYVCRGTTKTRHTQIGEPAGVVAGVTGRVNVTFSLRGGTDGAAGAAGLPLGKTQTIRVPWGACDPAFDPARCYDEYEAHCQFGPTPAPAQVAAAGRHGSASVTPIARRTVDLVRLALSPRQLSVVAAQANALFKRNDPGSRERAARLYLEGELRARGALLEAGFGCAVPQTANVGLGVVQGAACAALPALDRGLGRLRAGLDFFGEPARVPLNPLWRYESQRASLLSATADLSAAFQSWIALSAALDGQANLQAVKARFDLDAAAASRAVDGASARVAAASARVDDVRARIEARRQALASNRTAVATVDARIRQAYAAKSIGDLASDLLGKALAVFAGEMASQAATDIGDAFAEWVSTESSGTNAAPGLEADPISVWLDKVWKTTKDAAGKTVSDSAVKGAASSLGTSLADLVTGTAPPAHERSLVASEVERVLLDSEQRRLTMDAFDLAIALRAASTDLRLAELDHLGAQANREGAVQGAAKVAAYLSRGTPLDSHEVTALGRATYARALALVEEVTVRYRRLLRQAQYEALAYDDRGTPLFQTRFGRGFDITLANFPDVTAAVRRIDDYLAVVRPGSGAASVFTVELPAAAFVPATSADLDRLQAVGARAIPGLDQAVPLSAAFEVSPAVLASLPGAVTQKNVRLEDVRASWQGLGGAVPSTFVVLSPTDSFRVRRPAGTDLFAGFDLVRQAFDPLSGSVIGPTNVAALPACSGVAWPLPESCGVAGNQPNAGVFFGRSAMNRYLFAVPGTTALPPAATLRVAFTFRGALLP